MNTPRGVWLDDLTWQEAITRFDGNAVVVLPVARNGEFQPHLSLKTARLIARALGQKLLERLAVVVAPVFDADLCSRRETQRQILLERLDKLQSMGARRIAILDVAFSPGTSLDVSDDVLMLRVYDRSDTEEYVTSCVMALDPRSVRMTLLPAGSRSDAFAGERGMAAEVDALADALLAKWPDLR
jgi:Creatinine amidohydrolase.